MFACAFERYQYLRVHDRISYITDYHVHTVAEGESGSNTCTDFSAAVSKNQWEDLTVQDVVEK